MNAEDKVVDAGGMSYDEIVEHFGDDTAAVYRGLGRAREWGVEVEVVEAALLGMKENPELSVTDAICHGLYPLNLYAGAQEKSAEPPASDPAHAHSRSGVPDRCGHSSTR